jgi:endonuclease/exonuclease/phosphatase family metal-dependent hydrolase
MRIATFNTENLFSRAKVLNFKNNAEGDKLLAKIAILQDLLEATIYDKTKILSLYKELKDYIEIAEERGKLFSRSGFAIKGIKANGVADWDGSIIFKRDKFSDTTRTNTAMVLKKLNADICCLVEVEGRDVLSSFNSEMLGVYKFPYNISIDGNDDRGIDIGLLSKYPIKNIRTHIFDKEKPTSRSYIFSRDCLEVALEINASKSLHVLCNHLKSKGYSTSQAGSDNRRQLQAVNIKKIISANYDLKKDLVIVIGDFNDTPDSKPLKELLSTPNLYDVLHLQFKNDAQQKWTYHYNKLFQIDYILVSKPMKDLFIQAGVEIRGIFDIEKLSGGLVKPFKGITASSNAASDHGAVWAEFNL